MKIHRWSKDFVVGSKIVIVGAGGHFTLDIPEAYLERMIYG